MKNFEERKKRIQKMNGLLKKLYSNPKISLNYSNNWELLVAVKLSAQCTDKKVNEVTENLFKKYKTVKEYASTDIKEFEQDIRQTGFYKNKVKNIIETANIILKEFDGEIPQTMEDMLSLKGVARKTANVVLGNAFGIVEGIAVDTHVRRFAIRFNLTDSKDPKVIEKDLMVLLPKKEWFPITYRLISYGREVCPARKHDCTRHPLTTLYKKANDIWPKGK